MTLTTDDKKFIAETVAESIIVALDDVMVPALDGMEKRLVSKSEFSELSMKVDSIDRKLDSVQNRLDVHDRRVQKLEKIHPKGKHLTIAT